MKKKQVTRIFLDESCIKEDLNFLEFPTAVLDDKNASLVLELKVVVVPIQLAALMVWQRILIKGSGFS